MARFRLVSGPVPLHHQVYLDLRGAIEAGEWRPGDRLPPERDLAARYGCSLITIRRALGELGRERRIERSRGRGTFVTRPPIELDLDGTMSFTEEMQHRGLDAETRLIAAFEEPADPVVAEALDLRPGESTISLERLRVAGGLPVLLEQVHLPAARVPGLLAADLERRSLYDLLAGYGSPVVRAREWLEPVALPRREALLLDEEPGRPALRVEGVGFDLAGVPIEYARSFVRGDRARYVIEHVIVRAGGLRGQGARDGPGESGATALPLRRAASGRAPAS